MRPVPVFKAEADAGLADLIRENSSIAYLSPITAVSRATPADARVALAGLADLPTDPTFIAFRDVLVTTCWNRNRDVVLPAEAWASRNSIVDKPINLGHVYKDIVGHVLDSQAVDADYNPIPDDTPVDELPDFYHIVNNSVVYRWIGDDAHDEKMALLEREIADGKWYVSMESYFDGFDYGFLDEDSGESFVVARKSDTAFLTKHLWQYKGDGYYTMPSDGKRYALGRVLRNMHFKGKGIVANPGNEHSIIFSEASTRAFAAASSGPVYSIAEHLGPPAGETQESHPEAPKESNIVPEITPELAEARARIAELETEVKANADAASKAKIAELDGTVAELQTKLTSAQAQATTFESSLTEVQAKLTEAEQKLAAADARLAAYAAAEAKAERVAFVQAAGQKDPAKAEALAESLSALDKAAFEKTITTIAGHWKAEPAPAPVAAPADPVEAQKDSITAAARETTEAALIVSTPSFDAQVAELAKQLHNPNIARPTI